jgi:hypothetical protein
MIRVKTKKTVSFSFIFQVKMCEWQATFLVCGFLCVKRPKKFDMPRPFVGEKRLLAAANIHSPLPQNPFFLSLSLSTNKAKHRAHMVFSLPFNSGCSLTVSQCHSIIKNTFLH